MSKTKTQWINPIEICLLVIAWPWQFFLVNTSKIHHAFTFLSGWFFNCLSWIFLYVTPIYLLFQISMYQDTIFATKVALFQVFTKVLKIPIFGLSKWSVKVHLFAIFLGFCVVYWIPRLHAKDKFHTLNLLSLRVFWIRTNFGQNFMAAGTRKRHFTFCRFSQK